MSSGLTAAYVTIADAFDRSMMPADLTTEGITQIFGQPEIVGRSGQYSTFTRDGHLLTATGEHTVWRVREIADAAENLDNLLRVNHLYVGNSSALKPLSASIRNIVIAMVDVDDLPYRAIVIRLELDPSAVTHTYDFGKFARPFQNLLRWLGGVSSLGGRHSIYEDAPYLCEGFAHRESLDLQKLWEAAKSDDRDSILSHVPIGVERKRGERLSLISLATNLHVFEGTVHQPALAAHRFPFLLVIGDEQIQHTLDIQVSLISDFRHAIPPTLGQFLLVFDNSYVTVLQAGVWSDWAWHRLLELQRTLGAKVRTTPVKSGDEIQKIAREVSLLRFSVGILKRRFSGPLSALIERGR